MKISCYPNNNTDFVKYIFTKLAAVKLVDYINQEMDIGSTHEAIFIDLSKAFVMLNFDILIHKLQYYVRSVWKLLCPNEKLCDWTNAICFI